MKTICWFVGGLLAVLAVAACDQTSQSNQSSQPSQPSQPSAPAATNAPATKLLVFVVENRSLDEMSSRMPYTFGLAQQYAYATQYRAITHPSLPNYLAIAGGSTFGVTDDNSPAYHVVSGASVFGQAVALGKTAKLYADGMPGNCALEPGGDRYAVKHNPWAYFVDERALCERYDVPMDGFDADVASGDLPNAGMVVPNLCHDAHDSDCDLTDADTWLRDEVGNVLAGPDFASGHLAVVITADEDDRSQDNLVLTTLVHPSQHGHVVDVPLTHYSLTRLYEQILGASLLRRAATAPDMAMAFGLPLPAA
jgi:phosphatidylinositol-3-phosphatase